MTSRHRTGQSESSLSRREFLTGLFKPGPGSAGPQVPDLPDGVDIALSRHDCVAWGRGICDRCEKACPEEAVYFVGMMNPRIIGSRCTFCGLCVPACPVAAIVMRPPADPEREDNP